ncbi:MAG: tripartite tricarboxylate transporter substrate binding protein [Peptococcaceae bacterium]|nr:tripartite tricarboxylate transporter substrate binding protein [Peptococcaceae bacterium]
MKKLKYLLLASILLLAFLVAGCGSSTKDQKAEKKVEYPTKPITYVIPFDAGGQSDIEARRQQPLLEKYLGQPVTITYKPGGGGAVGWAELVKQKPDGYYMAGFNIPHIILQPLERKDAGYKTEEINPVAIFQKTIIGLAVPKNSPYNTLEDFIKAAKAKPGSITVGGSGTLTGPHLFTLLLEKQAGIKLQYIPFTGAAPATQALLGGHSQAMAGNSDDLVKYPDKIKVLGIASADRFKALPDVPTMKEQGYDIQVSVDRGVAVPPGTDPVIVKKLEEAFMKIANDENIKAQMLKDGFEPVAMNAEQSKKYIEERTKVFTELYKQVAAEKKQ